MAAEALLAESLPERTDQPTQKEPQDNLRHFLLDILETVGLAVLLFLVINALSARARVDGYSMLPTLKNNQYVLVDRLVLHYQRGDIIVFRPPMYPPESPLRRLLGVPSLQYEDYIKRIIGLPGDTVKVSNGTVSVNGIALTEPYITAAPAYTGEWTVPAGQLFVMGDNRNDSSDSHSWGTLPIANVLGKAILVYWPFSDWTVLRTPVVMAAH
jgi:signal peptidase I